MKDQFAKSITVYFSGREACAPGHHFGPAVRQHYLLHVILSGSGRFRTGNQLYQLKAGQAFLITPGITSYYEADLSDPWEYAWIGFEGYDVPDILKRSGITSASPIHTSSDPRPLTEAICLLADAFHQPDQNSFAVLARFYQIFALIADRQPNPVPEANAGSYPEAAKDYIRHNYGYDIRISDIARHIGIDRTYLFKLFKEKEGISPQEYLIQFRIKAAMNMLENPHCSITEAAYSCGFRDASSFCRHFKNKVGLSPLQYQKGRSKQ